MRIILYLHLLVPFWFALSFSQQENSGTAADSIISSYRQRLQIQRDSLTTACTRKLDSLRMELENYYRDRTIEFKQQIENRISALKDSIAEARSVKEKEFNPEKEKRAYLALRVALEASPREKSLFNRFIGTNDEKLDQYKIEKCKEYLTRFEPYGHSAQVLAEMIDLFKRKEDWNNMVLYGLRMMALYPDSLQTEKIKTNVRLIVNGEKIFENKKELISGYIDSTFSDVSFEDRIFSYITTLHTINRKSWYDMQETFENDYIYRYSDEHADEFLYWQAYRLKRIEMYHRALLTLRRIMTEFPQSHLLSRVYYDVADIYDSKFEDYEQAIDAYNTFLEMFPDDSLALPARFRIAKIYDKKLKQLISAIDAYKSVQDEHPGTEEAKAALLRIGEIYWKELNSPGDAITQYETFVDLYGDTPEAATAIMQIGDINLEKKSYREALNAFERIEKNYPDSENLLPALVKMVEIQEKELKDIDGTIGTLNKIIELFPDSDEAKKARKKLSKLQKD